MWAVVKLCVRKCFSFNRKVKDLIKDVMAGFYGGKCSTTDVVCPGVSRESVERKIRRSFRFAQLWGRQFHGETFDLSTYWSTDKSYDINKFRFDKIGGEVIEIDVHGEGDILDREPW